jgi:hypothetical protein
MARGWEDRSRDPPAEDDQGKASKDERTELLVVCTARFTASLGLVFVVGVDHRSALLAQRTRLERAVASSNSLFVDSGAARLVVGGAVQACGLDVGLGVNVDYLVVSHSGGLAGDLEWHRSSSKCSYLSQQPTFDSVWSEISHPGI